MCITKLTLTVYGPPVPKGRPRFTLSGTTYSPKATVDYEELVRISYRQKYGLFMIPKDKPIKMSVTAYMPIPKSTRKGDLPIFESETHPHTKTPDISNIIKIVEDALQKYAFENDSQISTIIGHKFYSNTPRVEIEIEQ